MKQDIRKGIKGSFLYKRLAYYQSEGFVALMKFLKDENLFDDFWEEFSFSKSNIEKYLDTTKELITIDDFFGYGGYSFSFAKSKLGEVFWSKKIFYNENFRKINDKIL